MKLGFLFVQGNGIISKLIRLVTWGKFSHVSIEITDELLFETDVFQNVQILRKEQTDYYDKYHEHIDIDITEEQFKKLQQIIEKTIGKKYDYKLILKILFKILFKRKINRTNEEEFICSELAGYVLYHLGIVDNYKVTSFSPNGLYRYLMKKH